jgi:hypothetical protein
VGPNNSPALSNGDIVAAHSPAAKASPASEDAIKALTMPFSNGPKLPNGDIVAARRPAAKARPEPKAHTAHKAPHAKGKAHLSQKKSVDLEVWKIKKHKKLATICVYVCLPGYAALTREHGMLRNVAVYSTRPNSKRQRPRPAASS